MTGWRISELLALRWEDVDLDAGTAITFAEDNKGKRDDRVKLHPVVIEHFKRLKTFDPCVFPWSNNRTALQDKFIRIQQVAGIHLPCRGKHEHTPACHVYGFHDLRRAFATMNAAKLSGDALQALMRHKSYATTQRYINLAKQLDDAVTVLHVPDVLKKGITRCGCLRPKVRRCRLAQRTSPAQFCSSPLGSLTSMPTQTPGSGLAWRLPH
jgi:integrase